MSDIMHTIYLRESIHARGTKANIDKLQKRSDIQQMNFDGGAEDYKIM